MKYLLVGFVVGVLIALAQGRGCRPPLPPVPPSAERLRLEHERDSLRAQLTADSVRAADSVAALAKARAQWRVALRALGAKDDSLEALRVALEQAVEPGDSMVPRPLYETALAQNKNLRAVNELLRAEVAGADAASDVWRSELMHTQNLLIAERGVSRSTHEELDEANRRLAENAKGWRIQIPSAAVTGVAAAAVVVVGGVVLLTAR